MTEGDYRDTLRFIRRRIRELGYSGLDERIMSDIRGSESPFGDLIFYLKQLKKEISLGSDIHLANVLRRIGRYVQTESGQEIEGIRITVSSEDQERYGIDAEIEVTPTPEFGEIAQELQILINELNEDHRSKSNEH